MATLIGQSLGRYRILEQIGQGGMAVVYKALDIHLEREVAVKLILPGREQSETFFKRFEREARALAQLSHPNIVKVLDYGEHEGMPYLVMEYIPGGNLKQHLIGMMPYQQAAHLLAPVAMALAYVHGKQIVHRDVKPANILLTRSGEPMLSDFGIAKLLANQDATELTATGIGLGTPVYMAPEQGLGKAVDHRADIYALGVVFYELITGQKPYSAETPMAVLHKQLTEPLIRPSKLVPDLPISVELVLLKALAQDPDKRYQNMQEFADSLEAIQRGLQINDPEGTMEQTLGQTSQQTSQQTMEQTNTYQPGRTSSFTPAPPSPQSQKWILLGGGALVLLGICVVSGIVFAWQYLNQGSNPEAASTLDRANVAPLSYEMTAIPTLIFTQEAQLLAATGAPSATSLPTVQNDLPIYLAYVVGSPFENSDASIYVANEDGRAPVCVACNACSQTEPSISVDGFYVVYQYTCSGQVDLYLTQANGYGNTNLTNTSGQSEREPAFSLDGSKIAYRVSEIGTDRNKNGTIWVMDSNGSDAHSLGIEGRGPAWSPDGKKLAYMSNESGTWQIYTYDLESRVSRKITACSTNCRWPAWSPTGLYIAYNLTANSGSMDAVSISYMRADGSGSPTSLVNSGSPGRPSWSASDWIAFNSSNGIEAVRSDGSQRRILVPGGSETWAPVWSR